MKAKNYEVTVNGVVIKEKEFAFDGCHKIYLLEDKVHRIMFAAEGYQLLPIEKLKEAYEESCGLQFISPSNLNKPMLVEQSQNAEIVIREL